MKNLKKSDFRVNEEGQIYIKKKRKRAQINNIRNEKITVDNAEIQRIIRDYYK